MKKIELAKIGWGDEVSDKKVETGCSRFYGLQLSRYVGGGPGGRNSSPTLIFWLGWTLQWTYWCLDVTSTHASTTYDSDPNVKTTEFNDPKTFRPRDIKSQKWTDCLSNQNCDTTTPKSES